jgi:hypothetical protein
MKHSLWYSLLASCAVSLSFAGQVGYAASQSPAHHQTMAKKR